MENSTMIATKHCGLDMGDMGGKCKVAAKCEVCGYCGSHCLRHMNLRKDSIEDSSRQMVEAARKAAS